MKLKRFAYLICAILVTALSLFPNTTADANSKCHDLCKRKARIGFKGRSF
jgi:hypothetical protein